MQGEIDVELVMREAADHAQRLARWQARMRRDELRQEEQRVLQQWWRASEKNRPAIVARHRTVFARIRANKRRAEQIERQERAISDAHMRQLGYAIRPGRVVPRYVRPDRLHLFPALPPVVRRRHWPGSQEAPLPSAV